MSNSDSFIDEVSEEVRRDRLFTLIRRYGWIAVLVVVLLVGGAAVNEYLRAQKRAEAQAFGDAVVAALAQDSPEARRAALLEIDAEGTRRALIAMLAADRLEDAEAQGATVETLNAVAGDDSLPQIYRELAVLKVVMIEQDSATPEDTLSRLEPLVIPGAPYRLLALEQQAIARVRAGDTEAAIDDLRRVMSDDQASRDLQARARQLIVALGGSLDAA